MRLILVRHGQTDGNKHRYSVGKTNLPLNEEGTRQAALLAERLAAEPIDAILSSDFIRAHQTAQIIAQSHPHLQVKTDPRLRERGYGEFEGLPHAEILKTAQSRGVLPYHLKPENGESGVEIAKRIRPFFTELIEQYKEQTVVVVAHGQLMRVALIYLLQLHPEKFEELRHDNTGVSILEVSNIGPNTLQVHNDTSHLQH